MSSLSTGVTQKQQRIKKLVRYLTGSVLQLDTGAQITKLAGARVRFVPQANPGTCSVGELNVDATNRLNVCTAANTWTVVGTQV